MGGCLGPETVGARLIDGDEDGALLTVGASVRVGTGLRLGLALGAILRLGLELGAILMVGLALGAAQYLSNSGRDLSASKTNQPMASRSLKTGFASHSFVYKIVTVMLD